MKSIFFVTNGYPHMELMAEGIKSYALLGDDVTVVECNEKVGQCMFNMEKERSVCWLCKKRFGYLKKQLPQNIEYIQIDEFDSSNKYNEIKTLRFEYDSLDEVKKITYNGINIGYGIVSTYISATRNLNPDISFEFKKFFDEFLWRVSYQAFLQEEIIAKKCPDRIAFFNGRVSDARTLVEIAHKYNIEFIVFDTFVTIGGKFCVDKFYNYMPHNLNNLYNLMNSYWRDVAVSEVEKIWLGKLFFENKQNGKYVGDKFYVKAQNRNCLPESWNCSKKKYVIFNSSEDEFFSIGDEYDKEKVFQSQIDGIRHICCFLERDSDVMVYLRIHPNLKNIKYKYHMDLLEMDKEYNNLEVIPAESKVSSYSLMQNADKVIVFGSTMGIEAAYAGKVVINLAGASYKRLNVTYNPSSIGELEELLINKDMRPINNMENILKFGYYFQRQNRTIPKFVEMEIKKYKILGKEIVLYPTKIWGSKVIYFLMCYFINKFRDKSIVPVKEKGDIYKKEMYTK